MADIKTATYLLPSYLLCYFHYGDDFDLEENDLKIVDKFVDACVEAHGFFHMLSDDGEEGNFTAYHDLRGYGWLACDCVEMTFHVDKE